MLRETSPGCAAALFRMNLTRRTLTIEQGIRRTQRACLYYDIRGAHGGLGTAGRRSVGVLVSPAAVCGAAASGRSRGAADPGEGPSASEGLHRPGASSDVAGS